MESFTSVVLPVHNQADHIEGIVRSYADATTHLKPIEFVLVENASTDATLEICQRIAEQIENVVVLHLDEGGWGRAVLAGLEAAQGDVLCYTNSARTQASDLVLLLERAAANPEFVLKANRRSRLSLTRRLGSGIYNLLCRSLFNLAIWDVNGTPKVFNRSVYDKLQLEEKGDLIDAELVALCELLDVPVIDIPIVSTARHGGVSTTNLKSAWKMYTGAIALKGRLKGRFSATSSD